MDGTTRAGAWRGGIAGLLLAGQILVALPASPQEEAPSFYDPSVLRTLQLTFDTDDFFSQIDRITASTEDGYLKGDLVIDTVLYPGVGVRFRGNTSQNNVGQKRSFKIAVDSTYPDQRVRGYKTIKLNNSALDPTFLREALYSQSCHRYFPSPTANHVILTINGENWGVYVNVQQFNKDFLGEWFEKTSGHRFKAPSGRPGGGGSSALKWLGSNVSQYQASYSLKSDEQPDPWGDLIRFCDQFNNTSDALFEDFVPSIFNVDGFLWQIALENVFADHDGYLSKGSDYTIYQEPDGGRLHTIQHDGNESFESTSWDLLQSSTDPERPVVKRLLAVPQYRQRYLAHVRTLLDEWFRWDVLGPMAEEMRDRIAPEVEKDTKKIYSTALFVGNFNSTVDLPRGGFGGGRLVGLREFVESRRTTLLASSHLVPTPPAIASVEIGLEAGAKAVPAAAVAVRVAVQGLGAGGKVLLHHRDTSEAPFAVETLLDDGVHADGAAGDGVYGGEIPGYPAGAPVRYYAEARGASASSFEPAGAEVRTLSYRVGVIDAESTPVAINELMAANDATMPDPQGEFDDWVELHNLTDRDVDLSGMYLSDNEDNPRKWRIPDGTTIAAGGYLVIWLDEDGKAEEGLHANFKLSAEGEIVWLLDTDERANQRLDAVAFESLATDIAWGRSPDGSGDFALLEPTPGWRNGSAGTFSSFVRGDVNADFALNLTDPVLILKYLFLSGEPPACQKAADADDSGVIEITDPVFLLNHLFVGGPEPPQPRGACGLDPTQDGLPCTQVAACE